MTQGGANGLCNYGTSTSDADNTLTLFSATDIITQAPTSANSSVSGKVTDVFGNGLRNVNVAITDSRGNAVQTKTNNFGNYRFEEVSAGELYVVSVSSKRYTFAVSTQLINVQEAVENVDFTANEVN